MEQSTPQFPDREQIREENQFLKMKMMLERGAHFGQGPSFDEMPPELENAFLKQIEAIENDFDNGEMITVFEKIGSPTHFKLPAEIADEEFPQCWEELCDYMRGFGIQVLFEEDAVSEKELYRFAIEDLFPYEMEDWSHPGVVCSFIYEMFYPDLEADNINFVKEKCLGVIFSKRQQFWDGFFLRNCTQLNEHKNLSFSEFNILVDRFKLAFDDITINTLDPSTCTILEHDSIVEGYFEIVGVCDQEEITLSGKWKVILGSDEATPFWQINYVELEGIRF